MRITAVNIPTEIAINSGLHPIKMERLGDVVLIAGKNGSGKSRLLNLIVLMAQNHLSKTQYAQTIQHVENFNQTLATNSSENPNWANWKQQLYQFETQLHQHSTLTFSNIADTYPVIHFVPKNLALDDCNDFAKSRLSEAASSVETNGVANLHRGTFAKIQQVQDRWFNATHPRSNTDPKERERAISDYERLNDLIAQFLNTTLERNNDNDACLFGFRLGQTKLSDGQKVLLQLCIAIYAQGATLRDSILVMDEPENHLHPSALIELFDAFKSAVPNGQIWIATHSVPLLAHFEPSSIWYMESNAVSYAGKIPEKVLRSLLGDDEQIARLANFLGLPAQLASITYAVESLLPPKTVDAAQADPQTQQIKDIIFKRAIGKHVRILDFGAGKGRLASAVLEAEYIKTDSLDTWFDYRAFDPDAKDAEVCKAAIEQIYGDSIDRYFNNEEQILAALDKESVDTIVLCNVFHEIDPKNWLSLFSDNGMILKLLKSDGSLLIVEDQRIPTGEKAYQNGFLVLDTIELKELFNIRESDNGFAVYDARADGRLKAHEISKDILKRITEQTRRRAIEAALHHAEGKIIELRQQPGSFKNGQLHGFWVQQFTNARLSLNELTKN